MIMAQPEERLHMAGLMQRLRLPHSVVGFEASTIEAQRSNSPDSIFMDLPLDVDQAQGWIKYVAGTFGAHVPVVAFLPPGVPIKPIGERLPSVDAGSTSCSEAG